ncbi:GFA family protein [soil metagenome]
MSTPANSKSRTASCNCGRLTAVAVGEPVRVSVCHCLACQRRTGSVFAEQARYLASSVTTAGASTSWVRTGDAGGKATFHFCPTCGDTVWYFADGRPDSIIIPVGAFGDPSFPPPTFSVYEDRKHGWVEMPLDIERMA